MPLFSRKPLADRMTAADAKAREKAAKKGVVTDGAVAVGHMMNGDRQDETFVVWPDRVELHTHGKLGSLLKAGQGAATVALSQVTSVSSFNAGVFGVVSVTHAGGVLEFRTDQEAAAWLAGQVRAAQNS